MNFLIVSSDMPLYDRTSAGLRLFTLMQLLRDFGHAVDFFVPISKDELKTAGSEEFEYYKVALEKMSVPTHTGAPERILNKKKYDAIIFEFYFTAYPMLDIVRILQPKAKVITDSVDLTYLRWHAKAKLTGELADLTFAKNIETKELATYDRSELVLTLTATESNELIRRLPGKRTFNLPNIHSTPKIQRDETKIPELLFIGSFTHEPNVDAVQYLYEEIWPLVIEQLPDIKLSIVGPKAPDDIKDMQNENIDVLGWVPETAPYLNRCWISLAPLRFGAGMKGKVGEAMAHGVPVIASSFGAQGLGAKSGHDLLIADCAKSFSDAIIQLINNNELRQSVGSHGRKLIEEKYSKDATSQTIPELIRLIESLPLREPATFLWLKKLNLRIKQLYINHIRWRINHG